MTEREIDTAIDRAVRDLMDVDTDAAFRARVTARLQRPARRQLLRPLAAVALTATALAVAFVWMRPSSSLPDVRALPPVAKLGTPTAAAPSQIASAGSNRPAALPRLQPTTSARVRRSTAPPIQRGAIVAAVADAPANDIAPLTAIDPIDVEPISQTPIAPSEIVVAPLSPISEMQISPLEPRTARD